MVWYKEKGMGEFVDVARKMFARTSARLQLALDYSRNQVSVTITHCSRMAALGSFVGGDCKRMTT
jgi:hypothetical protein